MVYPCMRPSDDSLGGVDVTAVGTGFGAMDRNGICFSRPAPASTASPGNLGMLSEISLPGNEVANLAMHTAEIEGK